MEVYDNEFERVHQRRLSLVQHSPNDSSLSSTVHASSLAPQNPPTPKATVTPHIDKKFMEKTPKRKKSPTHPQPLSHSNSTPAPSKPKAARSPEDPSIVVNNDNKSLSGKSTRRKKHVLQKSHSEEIQPVTYAQRARALFESRSEDLKGPVGSPSRNGSKNRRRHKDGKEEKELDTSSGSPNLKDEKIVDTPNLLSGRSPKRRLSKSKARVFERPILSPDAQPQRASPSQEPPELKEKGNNQEKEPTKKKEMLKRVIKRRDKDVEVKKTRQRSRTDSVPAAIEAQKARERNFLAVKSSGSDPPSTPRLSIPKLKMCDIKRTEVAPGVPVRPHTGKITPAIEGFLYVGDAAAAENKKKLQRLNVTHILNVADDVPNFYPSDFTYENLNVKDFGDDTGISRTFQQALDFMLLAQRDGRCLFVHCRAGQNRSVTIIVALLMMTKGWSLKRAYLTVKQFRPWIFLLEDNRMELINFEKRIRSKNSMTLESFVQFEQRTTPPSLDESESGTQIAALLSPDRIASARRGTK